MGSSAFAAPHKSKWRGPIASARTKKLWFQVTRVPSLLSSRHARPERGTLPFPPPCALLTAARFARHSSMLGTGGVPSRAKPKTRSGLSLTLGDRIRRRTALEGSKLLPSIFASPISACPARSALSSPPSASPLWADQRTEPVARPASTVPERFQSDRHSPPGFSPLGIEMPGQLSAPKACPAVTTVFPSLPVSFLLVCFPLTDHRSRICFVPLGSLIP